MDNIMKRFGLLVVLAVVLAACGTEAAPDPALLESNAAPAIPTGGVLNSRGFLKDNRGFKLELSKTPRSTIEANWGVSDRPTGVTSLYFLPGNPCFATGEGSLTLTYARADGSDIPTRYDSTRGLTVGDPLSTDVVSRVDIRANDCGTYTGGFTTNADTFKIGKGFTIRQLAENPQLIFDNFSRAEDISDGTSNDVYIDFGNGLEFLSDRVVYGTEKHVLSLEK